jgi:pilus assembly protein CpaF
MRGAEALTVQEAGRTGHTIVTSLHANSAKSAYERILTMCLQAGTELSEERLLKNIVEAIPIMIFKMHLPDSSRKYMEIFEATGVENGKVTGTMLYQYRINGYVRDDSGKIINAAGQHCRTGNISEALANKLHICGVDVNVIKKFARENFNPEKRVG